MVNHFASLLSNIDLTSVDSVAQKYELILGGNSSVSVPGGVLSVGHYTAITDNRLLLPLVARNYTFLPLPIELQRVYNILFPVGCSIHYKQFLLYSYLKVVDLTDRADDIKIVDNRISYSLEDLFGYFKFRNISIGSPSDSSYPLLVYGTGTSNESSRSFTNFYTISQQTNTATVLIYSNTQGEYYHPTKGSAKLSEGMTVLVTPSAKDALISNPITIGNTGLTCVIGGKNAFTASSNKTWSFAVDSPIDFNILDKLKTLEAFGSVVDTMFNYRRTSCQQTYQNLWETHYNPVYRLAGLLLAYVERVNLVWQKRAT